MSKTKYIDYLKLIWAIEKNIFDGFDIKEIVIKNIENGIAPQVSINDYVGTGETFEEAIANALYEFIDNTI